jgi:Kef-type K+ transport system membrane component KefB
MDNLIADVVGDVALILVVSSLLGAVARRCGQPTVIGQIIAGILLGPSLLGRLPGHLAVRLFPHAALSYLAVISQVAVTIFMFVVGYEMDWGSCRRLCRPAAMVAAGALLVPFGLGSGAALLVRPGFAHLGQSGFGQSFILFMGVAVAITALPVLAAIIRERGIAGTTAGVTATTAAGIMDMVAWLLLAAALLGTADKPGRPLPVTCALIIGFVVVMLLVVRPVLGRWICRPGAVLANQLPVALTLTLGSAWVTASLGLHPVFGGLLAGLAMPRKDGIPDPDVLCRMEEVGSVLLPLFFIVTGLSVNIGTLDGTAFLVLALLIAIASVGKIGPAYAASRIGGLPRKDAATVAALVNTRGLTELIALNVGFSAGLISHQLFDVLVVMAVLTTILTAPLLRLIRPTVAVSQGASAAVSAAGPVEHESTTNAFGANR